MVANHDVVIDTEGQIPSLSDLGVRSFEEEHSSDNFIRSLKRFQYIFSSDRLKNGEPFILDLLPHFALIMLYRKSSPYYSTTQLSAWMAGVTREKSILSMMSTISFSR